MKTILYQPLFINPQAYSSIGLSIKEGFIMSKGSDEKEDMSEIITKDKRC